MRDLIFDTETTGIRPRGMVKLENEPYVIQLASILYEEERPVYTNASFVNNGKAVRVPTEKFFIDNGLTNEVVDAYGIPAKNVINNFVSMVSRADRIIAHNMNFDSALIYAMLKRYGNKEQFFIWHNAPKFYTMRSLTDVLKIPNKWGKNKWPTLDEAYRKLVNLEGFEDAHDALIDVRACREVLLEITKQNIKLQKV